MYFKIHLEYSNKDFKLYYNLLIILMKIVLIGNNNFGSFLYRLIDNVI